MNAVTIRRLLVFGVCAVGVGALYATPSLPRAVGPATGPRPNSGPPARPSEPAATAATAATRSTAPSAGQREQPAEPAEVSTADVSVRQTASRPAVPRGATPFDPVRDADRVAPAPVADIVTARVTKDRLSLSWPAASDNVGVIGYRVWLNGYEVATTAETHATVRWFNDDLSENVVQVRALDAAGNASATSPNLLVARPTPPATPSTPAPTPTPTPSPTAEATPGVPAPTEPTPTGESTAADGEIGPAQQPPTREPVPADPGAPAPAPAGGR